MDKAIRPWYVSVVADLLRFSTHEQHDGARAYCSLNFGWIYAEGRERHLLSVPWLLEAGRQVPEHDENGHRVDVPFAVAVNLLVGFFGLNWASRHVLPNQASDTTFLRGDSSDEFEFDKHRLRVIWLAEMIFNFQRKPGLEGPLENLRGGQIETAFAELEVAKLLSQYDIGFRFVPPEGRQGGKNYDLEFFHPNGELCPGETKCKVDSTKLSDATIINTLKQARKQLPSGASGVVFVKVPQAWMAIEGFRDRFSPLARAVLSGTSRVVSIIAYASMLDFRSNGEIGHGLVGREVVSHTRNDGRDWLTLLRYENDHPSNPRGWVSITDLFAPPSE